MQQEKLGILIGLLLTDGSVSRKQRSWRITFSGRSETLHKLFRDTVRDLFGVDKFGENSDKLNIKSTSFYSTEIALQVLEYTNGFRTKGCMAHFTCPLLRGREENKPCKECKPVVIEDVQYPSIYLPDFFYDLPSESLAKIFQAMFSADGSVALGVKWNTFHKKWDFTRSVQLTCSNPFLLDQITNLLTKKFNMKPQKWKKQVVLERKDDIIKFKEIIGFLDGVKISEKSKNWVGFEKNKLLNILISTFSLKKRNLDNFKTREEIINFVKGSFSAS